MANTEQKSREEVRTFWIGPPLSYYEIVSLKSFVATGARVFLYSFDDLVVPDGVELCDARDILSDDVDEFRSANGDITWSKHSDIFRYAMLQKFGGWYADLDVICLQPELPKADVYFGAARNNWLNTAVLKFPPRHVLIDALLKQSRDIVPTIRGVTTEEARIAIGPALINRLVDELSFRHLTQPESKAYEIAFVELLSFFDPAQCANVQSRLAASDFTHLWNEGWRSIRIPKNLGPPAGSFLDLIFRKFGVDVPERGRLRYEAVASWEMEHRLLNVIKHRRNLDKITMETVNEFASADQFQRPRQSCTLNVPHIQTSAAQTLRTFWHGDTIGPYQLLCLKSFADRGHQVEVFSYHPDLVAPDWLKIRNAAEILPQDQVLHPLQEEGQFAIHSHLFRWTLLLRLGGWWIDPDVLLLQPDMPSGDIFFAEKNVFGHVPTTVLRFPPEHPLIAKALAQVKTPGTSCETWEREGSLVFTDLVAAFAPRLTFHSTSLGPVTWLNVPDLFDPRKKEELSQKCSGLHFLHFQDAVWKRAGVPQSLAPPDGSFLDELLARHQIGVSFSEHMEFSQLNRWIWHMYRSAGVG